MRRGLETLGVVLILAVCWMSIARLSAKSYSASASVSIHIERPEEDTAAAPDPGPELAATPAALDPIPGMDRTTVTLREGGRETVLHTQTPQI
jgi:hypothetical protein